MLSRSVALPVSLTRKASLSQDLLRQLLHPDPSSRASIDSIRAHSFLSDSVPSSLPVSTLKAPPTESLPAQAATVEDAQVSQRATRAPARAPPPVPAKPVRKAEPKLEEHVPSGKKGDGPSMMEKLLAQRAAEQT